MLSFRPALMGAVIVGLVVIAGCFGRSREDRFDTVRVTGSDTMVNLALSWAEEFTKDHPAISVTIKGGGSGVGLANLISGKIEIATASRPMKPSEIEQAKQRTGKEPVEIIVGSDALAIYVHKENPLDSISIADLAEIYGEEGKITKWHELGIDNAACTGDEIIRISRQNSSGTYAYFKEAVLGKHRDYKQGYTAQSGSSDVVTLVSRTPCAIGYSGMGYRDSTVKVLNVSAKPDGPAVEPTVEHAQDGSYPISRPLYLYTIGEPSGAVQEFIQWILSDAGQRIVEKEGYVPLAEKKSAGQ